jgi:hypothetical protein
VRELKKLYGIRFTKEGTIMKKKEIIHFRKKPRILNLGDRQENLKKREERLHKKKQELELLKESIASRVLSGNPKRTTRLPSNHLNQIDKDTDSALELIKSNKNRLG